MFNSASLPYRLHKVAWPVGLAGLTVFMTALALSLSASGYGQQAGTTGNDTVTGVVSSGLAEVAGSHPSRRVEVIVQLDRGTNPRVGKDLIAAAGGHVTGELHVINGLAARMTAAKAETPRLLPRRTRRLAQLDRQEEQRSTTAGWRPPTTPHCRRRTPGPRARPARASASR